MEQKNRLDAIYKIKSAAWMKENFPRAVPGSDDYKKILHDHQVDEGNLLQ